MSESPTSEDVVRWGYWPAMQSAGQIPAPIQSPAEFDGSPTLNLACTQTGLGSTAQRKLVQTWCAHLPTMPLKTLVFSSHVNQALFEASMQIAGLQALFVKWGGVKSIESISGHASLVSLYIDGPSITGLRHLQTARRLKYLFVGGVREASDPAFVGPMDQLIEFGLAAGSLPMRTPSLEPLGSLRNLTTLWLLRIRPTRGGLTPLHRLERLRSFRTELDPDSEEVLALRRALPGIDYMEPVWG